MCGVTLKAKE